MFKNLEDYYNLIEKDDSLSQDYYRFSAQLNLLKGNIDYSTENSNYNYELYFNDFHFLKGEFIPRSQSNIESYPNLSLFGDFEYIKSRAASKQYSNPKYKAKYNHLLWVSPHKHISFAESAIENYFIYLKNSKPTNDYDFSGSEFSIIFENLFCLSQAIDYKKDEIILFLKQHLAKDELCGYEKYSMMKYVSSEPKKISKEHIQHFFEYSNQVIDSDLYLEYKKEYLDLIISLAQKLGKSPKEYYDKLGDYYIQESAKHKNSFALHHFYLDALNQYKKARNNKKVEEIAVLIEKAKSNLSFPTTKYEISNDKLQKYYKSLDKITTDIVEKETSAYIYSFLACEEWLFPKAHELDAEYSFPISSLMSTTNFDINRNISTKKDFSINQYDYYIKGSSIPTLRLIFRKGIEKNKINFITLKEFLENKMWYASDSIQSDNNENSTFNWLELILPSLDSFFQQSEINFKTSNKNNAGYILAIDSLVLKFEGILRAFSHQIGAQTIESKENETQERISFEKLLDNEKLKEVVPENDRALFRYIFTSEGINLRNNIAHCFYKSKNYSPVIFWLLICTFLKIGSYSFKKKE